MLIKARGVGASRGPYRRCDASRERCAQIMPRFRLIFLIEGLAVAASFRIVDTTLAGSTVS
jgi:hypothetical protein